MIKQNKFPMYLICCMIISIFLSGCSGCAIKDFNNLSTVDKAAVSVKTMGYTFIGLHKTYSQFYILATESQRAYLDEHVNPIINKTQDVLELLVRAVAIWKQTDTKPEDYETLFTQAQELITKVLTLVEDIRSKGISTFVGESNDN